MSQPDQAKSTMYHPTVRIGGTVLQLRPLLPATENLVLSRNILKRRGALFSAQQPSSTRSPPSNRSPPSISSIRARSPPVSMARMRTASPHPLFGIRTQSPSALRSRSPLPQGALGQFSISPRIKRPGFAPVPAFSFSPSSHALDSCLRERSTGSSIESSKCQSKFSGDFAPSVPETPRSGAVEHAPLSPKKLPRTLPLSPSERNPTSPVRKRSTDQKRKQHQPPRFFNTPWQKTPLTIPGLRRPDIQIGVFAQNLQSVAKEKPGDRRRSVSDFRPSVVPRCSVTVSDHQHLSKLPQGDQDASPGVSYTRVSFARSRILSELSEGSRLSTCSALTYGRKRASSLPGRSRRTFASQRTGASTDLDSEEEVFDPWDGQIPDVKFIRRTIKLWGIDLSGFPDDPNAIPPSHEGIIAEREISAVAEMFKAEKKPPPLFESALIDDDYMLEMLGC